MRGHLVSWRKWHYTQATGWVRQLGQEASRDLKDCGWSWEVGGFTYHWLLGDCHISSAPWGRGVMEVNK